MAPGNQSFTGTTGDDVFIGAAGVDTVTTNIGTDVILTNGGDDVITIDGVGNKTIDGGAGTDSLTISVSGHTSLSDFHITNSSDLIILTSKTSGNTIGFKNLESLVVGSVSYVISDGEYGSTETGNHFWSTSTKSFYAFDGSYSYGGYSGGIIQQGMPIFSWEPVPGLPDIAQDASSTVTFIGSNVGDYIALGAHRDGNVGGVFKGSYNISLGDGNDKIGDGGFKNGDSVDMGAGDDTVELRINQNTHGPTGTPTISNFDMVKLDGGAGTDTLSFAYSVGDGSEITLSTGGAVNFENLIATSSAEIVREILVIMRLMEAVVQILSMVEPAMIFCSRLIYMGKVPTIIYMVRLEMIP